MSKKHNMKQNEARLEKRLSKLERERKPLANVHRIGRGPDTSGWQHDHERIAEVLMDNNGSFLCSVIQRIQPGLQSFAPWLAETLGQGWAKYLLKMLQFTFVSDVPTTFAGNLILGWLPDATAPLPNNMVEATQAAIYASGNINDNITLRIPKRCLDEAFGDDMKYTRQGFVEGDPNLYDCGVFFVASEGFSNGGTPPTTLPCVGFVDAKLDISFADKQVPRNTLTVGDGFNARVSIFVGAGGGTPGAFHNLWAPLNNNPAGWMVNDDFGLNHEFYVPPGVFLVTVYCPTVANAAVSTVWTVQTSTDSVITPTPAFSASDVNGGRRFIEVIGATDISDNGTVTVLVNNQDERVEANLPTVATSMYRTGMRLRISPGLLTQFPPLDASYIYIERLPTEGAVGLDGVGEEASSLTKFLQFAQRYNMKVSSLPRLVEKSRQHNRLLKKQAAAADTAPPARLPTGAQNRVPSNS